MIKQSFKFYIIIWAVFLVLFNIVCFVTPAQMAGMNKFGGAFWSGYIFIMLAFIGQIVCAGFAFKAENLEKLFYSLPLITVSYTGLVLMLIAGSVIMAVPDLPNWIGIIACLLILALNAVAVVKASVAAGFIENIDQSVKVQTGFMRELTAEAESILAYADDETIKAECKRVYEAFRYSDPVSHEKLSGIESQIEKLLSRFTEEVKQKNETAVTETVENLCKLISERNRKCKLYK